MKRRPFTPLRILLAAFAAAFVFALSSRIFAAEPDAAGVEFFEKKIRPLLIEHCLKCHSSSTGEKLKGGLALDTRDGVLKGGDNGPALVPGQPDRSLLIKAVRYADENLQMPPKNKKLAAAQIADLEEWIRLGAPDPRTGAKAVSGPALSDPAKVRDHWAFKPVKKPAVPTVKNTARVWTPVDAFVLAKLEAQGLTPSPIADRATWLRRVTYDLTGLPPTFDDVQNFLRDTSPGATDRVVDRLLKSQRYGERWGRHWLDVARYADTKGYLAGDEQRRFAFSYTYRDYVIRAFNEDLPFNRFIIEQLAADSLPLGDDKRPLAALGYLTLGRRFLNNTHDIIDDRIDVVTRGLMGLTVQCARCHDHKYDPVPARDYYSLYGVFASSREPAEKPLLGTKPPPEAHAAYLAEKKKREDELEKYRVEQLDKALAELRKRAGEYLLAAHEARSPKNEAMGDRFFQERKLDANTAHRWQRALKDWQRGAAHPIFSAWFAFADLPESEFATKAPAVAARLAANADGKLNPLVAKTLEGAKPASLKDVSEKLGKLLTAHDAATPHTDAQREAVRLVLRGADAPANVPAPENDSLLNGVRPKLRQMKAKVDEVDAVHPGAPPRGMVLVDNDSPNRPYVFLRGNPGNRGPDVPRQFLEAVAGPDRKPFKKGSGRLELAEAIASADNPLVNRVWLHHFGQGLVRTPSDFGVRSDPPTHPELLDYLAARFVEEGWSIKKLHRWIVLSSTYAQSSVVRADYARRDPANFLLWKMNRQRLDFEELRDSLLAASAQLDLTPGGRGEDMVAEPFSKRRAVYSFIDRQNLPAVFRTFDFASPDITSAQRFSTTVPQQALFMLNSPFVIQQSRALVARAAAGATTDAEKLRAVYKILFQREPAADELNDAADFLRASGDAPAGASRAPRWSYGYGAYDAATQRVTGFTPLAHTARKQIQAGTEFPDPKLGHLMLTATGGHPGNDAAHAVIRRWSSPADGAVKISGTLRRLSPEGDGARGRIVSSRHGKLGEWVVKNSSADTVADAVEVRPGDTIDFVVDPIDSPAFDSFSWSPVLKLVRGNDAASSGRSEWNAESDFAASLTQPAQALTPLEKLAQVLLAANEFVFVD
jgi:hypothetical protein